MTRTEKQSAWSILGPVTQRQGTILSPEALEFYVALHRAFNPRRLELLKDRKRRQRVLEGGAWPDFSPETQSVRQGNWLVDPVPDDLLDRRVELTGPVECKMIVKGLNSGASCYMADFEDAHSPTWSGTLDGQVNLRSAVRAQIEYTNAEGRQERLHSQTATLLVRPRGWHLPEKHLRVDGEVASASLFDFAFYFFHNARYRWEQGSGVYLYLPKLEHYLEARLWNDVFVQAEEWLGLPKGTVKATVLIEHILAAFQMEEMLYELRHHSAGLNCGHWDYIFSYIKTFTHRPEFLVPDRAQVTMTSPFMRAYSLGCIDACHKRRTFAMGGMSAYIPAEADSAANRCALENVRADKRREATDGHDGTWVAHPALVRIALEEFDQVLGLRPNQIGRNRKPFSLSRELLLEVPQGTITEEGLRLNIRVAIQYLAAWLGGRGCIPLDNLREDAATAEISRTQVWQWVHNPRSVLEDGRSVTLCLVEQFVREELDVLEAKRQGHDKGKLRQAAELFEQLVLSETLEEFLTIKTYALLD